jgi:hypothetical protein
MSVVIHAKSFHGLLSAGKQACSGQMPSRTTSTFPDARDKIRNISNIFSKYYGFQFRIFKTAVGDWRRLLLIYVFYSTDFYLDTLNSIIVLASCRHKVWRLSCFK